jgi:hypothetical protein
LLQPTSGIGICDDFRGVFHQMPGRRM